MNEKEIAEIRRRFRREKSNISRVCGCFVNEQKEIISEFDQSLGLMSETENEAVLALLRKTLSGGLGSNLCDVEFSTRQVLESAEHKTLMQLRDSELGDKEQIRALYERIIASLTIEGNYLIMLAQDRYDVPTYSKDGEKDVENSQIFRYILCAICPVKIPKPMLSYAIRGGHFRSVTAESAIGTPVLGFMFPTFDDRCANIYKTLYYTKDTSENHAEFCEAVFGCEIAMAADMQKQTFDEILIETVGEKCNLRVVRSLHAQVSEMVTEHKESREEEPLTLNKRVVKEMLEHSGVEEKSLAAFEEKFENAFGKDAEIAPANLVTTKRFELKTPDVVIKVNPERTDLVKTRVIDGVKYILISANEDVEVNGVNIHIQE